MHELFLTAVVGSSDLDAATAVLQGLCGMTGWQNYQRVLFYAGPPQPRGLPAPRSIQPSPYGRQWSELKQHLTRQSYVLQARYEVSRNRDFGAQGDANGSPVGQGNLNALQGALRWADLPDPTGNRPVTQRKKVEIPDQRNLLNILTDNSHRFKSEMVEESFTYFRENVEFSMTRYYRLPIIPSADGSVQPLQTLPAWEDLSQLDQTGAWLLVIKNNVVEDNSPEKMQKAHDELMAIKEELAGVFDFKAFDRRAHDTRVAQQSSNMPAPLPQTVRA